MQVYHAKTTTTIQLNEDTNHAVVPAGSLVTVQATVFGLVANDGNFNFLIQPEEFKAATIH